MAIGTLKPGQSQEDYFYDKKIEQALEMSALARQDGDIPDMKRWADKAAELKRNRKL